MQLPSPSRRPLVRQPPSQQPQLPAPPLSDAEATPHWELMSSRAMAAATGGSPMVKLEAYADPPLARRQQQASTRAGAGAHAEAEPMQPPPRPEIRLGGRVSAPRAPSSQRDPRRAPADHPHLPHGPLPPGVQQAAAQMKALMDSTAAFEPAVVGGGAIGTTPSNSSSYDAATDHIMEGLLCPDSVDAMRKWAALLDPSFPAGGEDDDDFSGLLPGAEAPAALSGYKHAGLLSDAADVVCGEAAGRSAYSQQVRNW